MWKLKNKLLIKTNNHLAIYHWCHWYVDQSECLCTYYYRKYWKVNFLKAKYLCKVPAELKEKNNGSPYNSLSCGDHLASNSDHFIILFLVKLNMQQASKNFWKFLQDMSIYCTNQQQHSLSVEKLIKLLFTHAWLSSTKCTHLNSHLNH